MTINPKLADLMALLTRGTETGRLRWQTTPDANTFRVTLGSGFMRLARNEPDWGTVLPRESYTLTILTNNGQLVAEFASNAEEDRSALADLFGVARRSALNLDAVLDQMLQELKVQVG